jgi:hypothetical protein
MAGCYSGSLAHDVPESQTAVKLLFLPMVLGLAFITGVSGTAPLKESIPSMFTWRDELARVRAEVADLRHGRGSAAPEWVAKYADALCAEDATFVVEHTEASLGMTARDIEAQFARLRENGLNCTSVRYLGSVGDRQFVFVLHQGPRDVWYILTLSEDGHSVAKVE